MPVPILREKLISSALVHIAYLTEVVQPTEWPHVTTIDGHPAAVHEPHNGHWRVDIQLPPEEIFKELVVTVQIAPL